MGKSTLAKIDAREFRKETGGYVIGHSPNGQIGESKDIAFYNRIDGLFGLGRGLRRHPEMMHFVTTGPAEDILSFADSLALAVRKSAHKREWRRFNEHRPAPKGLQAPPVLAVIDEGTSMRRHPSNLEIEQLERMLVNARHKHMSITWITQAPTSRQWVLLEQANRIRVFRYTHEYGANALRAAGIRKEIAYDLAQLDPFTYYAYDKGLNKGGRYEMLPRVT